MERDAIHHNLAFGGAPKHVTFIVLKDQQLLPETQAKCTCHATIQLDFGLQQPPMPHSKLLLNLPPGSKAVSNMLCTELLFEEKASP